MAAVVRLQRRAGAGHGPCDDTFGSDRTHVSGPERQAFGRLRAWGLVDAYRLRHPERGRYTWWDYRAGNFHKNFGMRIDHLLVTPPLAERTVEEERRFGRGR